MQGRGVHILIGNLTKKIEPSLFPLLQNATISFKYFLFYTLILQDLTLLPSPVSKPAQYPAQLVKWLSKLD